LLVLFPHGLERFRHRCLDLLGGRLREDERAAELLVRGVQQPGVVPFR
jgi:hypothetical protein